jgi:hypothetical protein
MTSMQNSKSHTNTPKGVYAHVRQMGNRALCKPLLTTAIMTACTLYVDTDKNSSIGKFLNQSGLASAAHASGYTIDTIGGTGTCDGDYYFNSDSSVFADTGSPSIFSVDLAVPCAIVKDRTDNSIVFIDKQHDAIRRVSASGTVSTILSGFNVNGYHPNFLTIDSATGSLYATDGQNVFSIVKNAGTYSAPNILATSNGDNTSGTRGGALGWSVRPTYDTYCWHNITQGNPQGIAFAPANNGAGPYLYVGAVDSIFQIDLNVSNAVGNVYAHRQIVASLNSPTGLALNAAANRLHVIDNPSGAGTGCCVRSYAAPAVGLTYASSGDIVAGNDASVGFTGDSTSATSATLQRAINIAIDSDDGLYISDTGNNRIRYVPVTTSGQYTAGNIYTIAGGGQNSDGNGVAATSAELKTPTGLFVDANKTIFMTEGDNNATNLIRKISLPPAAVTVTAGMTSTSNALTVPYYSSLLVNGGGTLKANFDNSTNTYGGITLAEAGTTVELNGVNNLGSGTSATNILTMCTGTGLQAGSNLAAKANPIPSLIALPIKYSGNVTINTCDDANAAHGISTNSITCTAPTGTTNTITVKGGGHYTPAGTYTSGGGADILAIIDAGTTVNLTNKSYVPATVNIGNGAALKVTANNATLPDIKIG